MLKYFYLYIIDTLLKTNPLNFVFVELNSVMQSNARILSKMYLLKNNKINSDFYSKIARRFQVGIDAVSIFSKVHDIY